MPWQGAMQSHWQGICRDQGPGCGNATGVRIWDAVALCAWIAGAGSGVAAVVLWARPNDRGNEAPHAELRAGPGAVSLAGTF